MNVSGKSLVLTTALALLSNVTLSQEKSNANRFYARGANGFASGVAGRNQYGAGARGRILGPNAGAGGAAGNYVGPNGGTFQGGRAFGYRRGVGAASGHAWQGSLPDGANGSSSASRSYNAQTGQGTGTSNMQLQSKSGQKYGYNDTTNYTKGQGGQTVINTDNKGSYDVNYGPGEKPTITSTTPSN